MADAASTRFTFILIHGAWQGAWAWETVVPRLKALGHDAIAVDLPGNSHNPMAPSKVNLEAYAAHVVEIIDATEGPIVMVGHSMGGTAAAQACELRPQRIALAIFLAAFLLPDGAHKRVTYDAAGLLSSIDPASAVEVFYHKADRMLAEAAARRLTPQPEGGRRSLLKLSAERFGTVPRVYIEAREDRSVHLPLQRKMQEMSPCRAVYGLDSDHAPQLSDPDALVALVMTAIAEHAR
jgi:YD repeat-containing protein